MKFLLAFFLFSRLALANSPAILFEHDPTLLTTTVNVVVLTGSADDPLDKSGLTNLMGELILRGTLKRNRTQFQSEIEKLGGAIGVGVSHEMVSFSGMVIKENTLPFLTLMEETLYKPGFSKTELESLRREVVGEISHVKNSNMRLAGLALRKELCGGTSLEHTGLGTLSSIKKIKLEDLIKTYNREFHQGNIIFAVASPLKESELKPVLAAIGNRFPKGERRKRAQIEPKVPTSPRLVVIHKPKTSTGSLLLGQAGITAQDPMRYVLSTGNFMFGGEPLVSTLFRVVRSDLGWTYGIGSTYQSIGQLMDQKGFFVVSAIPSVEFTTKAILKIQELWGQYLKEGIPSDGLKLAQDSLINSYPFEFDEPKKRLWNVLRSKIYGVPVLTPDEFGKEIGGITNSKILSALKERQNPNGWVISLVADKGVVEKQLLEEQKNVREDKRLKIARVYTPDELVN